MNDNIQIRLLFPTCISESIFPRELTEDELKHLHPLDVLRNNKNIISSNKTILEIDELKEIKDFCLSAINQYLVSVINPVNQISLYITQSWININQKGDYHKRHKHPNSLLSGVFYIETSETDSIMFHKSSEWLFDIEPSEVTHLNCDHWHYPVKNNTLLIFPSFLEHEVPQKLNEGNRISLSFNTFFTGTAGKNERSTLLTL